MSDALAAQAISADAKIAADADAAKLTTTQEVDEQLATLDTELRVRVEQFMALQRRRTELTKA